jgi:flagellar biogenesis protein FliO
MRSWGAAPLAALSLSLLAAAPVRAEGTDNYPASDISQLTGAPFPLPLPAPKPIAQVPLPDPNVVAQASAPSTTAAAPAPQAVSPVGNTAESQAKAKALAESVRTPPWLRQSKQPETAAAGTRSGSAFSPWRVGIMLALVGGLAGFALYAKRRKDAKVPGQKPKAPVKVINSTRLGPKAMAVVTEVNGRRLLLGVTDHSVNALAWLDQAELLAEAKNTDLPELDRDFLPEAPELDRYGSPFAASALDDDGFGEREVTPARDSERLRESSARREAAVRRETPARGQPLRAPARETKSSPSGSFLRVLKSAVGRGNAAETLESSAIPNAPLDRMADEMRDEVKLSRRAIEREQEAVEGQAAGLLARAKRGPKS